MASARFVLALQAARRQLDSEYTAAQERLNQVWRETYGADAQVILHHGHRYEPGPQLRLVPTGAQEAL